MLNIKYGRYNNMKVSLCIGDFCIPNKCPVVDVQEDKVIIGEKDNICTLTKEQFEVLKQKVKSGEL
jgi:predicted mannosyl-3-phosphoglycerate phosphatase (HAD superfamily)